RPVMFGPSASRRSRRSWYPIGSHLRNRGVVLVTGRWVRRMPCRTLRSGGPGPRRTGSSSAGRRSEAAVRAAAGPQLDLRLKEEFAGGAVGAADLPGDGGDGAALHVEAGRTGGGLGTLRAPE